MRKLTFILASSLLMGLSPSVGQGAVPGFAGEFTEVLAQD
jgi:hypothetical protein